MSSRGLKENEMLHFFSQVFLRIGIRQYRILLPTADLTSVSLVLCAFPILQELLMFLVSDFQPIFLPFPHKCPPDPLVLFLPSAFHLLLHIEIELHFHHIPYLSQQLHRCQHSQRIRGVVRRTVKEGT